MPADTTVSLLPANAAMTRPEGISFLKATLFKQGLPGWLRSLRVQIALALGLLFALLATSVGLTLYELSLRRHDYQILNLAGQLRVNAANMHQQARNYLRDTPTDPVAYQRDLGLFYADLRRQIKLSDDIIASFKARRLSPELTGHAAPLTCKWDAPSRHQLDISADDWANFKSGLQVQLGNDPAQPRLNWGAEYIAQHGGKMTESTDRLARSFQIMMESKLAQVEQHNRLALAAAALIMIGLVGFLHRQLMRPLRLTMAGFKRVAQGELGYQIPVMEHNEVGLMADAFNQLSMRLHALFQLTDRINQGKDLDATLRFVKEAFGHFLPVDWVGLLMLTPEGQRIGLERSEGSPRNGLQEGTVFALNDPALVQALQQTDAVRLDSLNSTAPGSFSAVLHQANLGSAILLKVGSDQHPDAVLVFASVTPAAYTQDQIALLENVAGQLSHALDKTVFMERLVVAAVQGLSKLAESRDPETGDHLTRMALYSALVAEELGKTEAYKHLIDAAYVRRIHQFAPMHDIGKVGIADSILLKPGALDAAERAEMQRHPGIGGEVLRRCEQQVNALGCPIFQMAVEIAEAHHERYDGSGYPQGLAAEAIPLSARIVAAADVFDALTSKRPYKTAWSIDEALNTMEADSGKHFDPDIIAALKRAMPRVLEVYAAHKHV
ncbi:MAG: HD domain-containing phosphohydrolase [Thiobacillus sp.]